MAYRSLAVALVAAFGLAGCCSHSHEHEVPLALSAVPQPVVQAVQTAMPGSQITEAERETKGEQILYELDVKSNGKTYEMKVDSAGRVLSTKEETKKGED